MEQRRMPLCLNVLLGEAFASAGAIVRYSHAADNDDTLASYAQVKYYCSNDTVIFMEFQKL